MTKTYGDFFTAVLKKLNITPHPRILHALADVATLEGLNDRYNPLNSVVPCGKSTPFNSVGVQDYKSYGNGINGTVRLLRGDPWTDVVDAMRRGARTATILDEFSKVYASWGAHPNWPTGNGALLDKDIAGNHEPAVTQHVPASKPAPHHSVGSKARTYKVRSGDTLYSIAGKLLDRPGRWREIAHANKIIAPYTIYPGQRLTIPTE